MSIELRPLGVACNIGCLYCYQNKHRDAGNSAKTYDMTLMKAAVAEEGGPFHLFGGEPLLIDKADLEELWQWGLERFGTNGLQTNGVLLDEDHVRMIRQFNVTVGISLDGPGELNDARWANTLEKTRAATQRSEWALSRLVAEKLVGCVHVQLSRCNASAERLPTLCDWLRSLDAAGVPAVRLHILEVENDSVRRALSLTADENIEVFTRLASLENEFNSLRFDIFRELERNLQLDDDGTSCVWRGCDPYTTEAVRGVGGRGERHNCGLTDKEGIDFQRPDHQGFERYIALYHTPHQYGGCQGCRFFLVCKGQCPGTAIDGDWRNRSENCAVWLALYTKAEVKLKSKGRVPLSLHEVRGALERSMLNAWAVGKNPTLAACAATMPSRPRATDGDL